MGEGTSEAPTLDNRQTGEGTSGAPTLDNRQKGFSFFFVFVLVFAFITRDQNQGFLHAKFSGSYSTAGCVSKCDVRVLQLADTSLTPEKKGAGLI